MLLDSTLLVMFNDMIATWCNISCKSATGFVPAAAAADVLLVHGAIKADRE